MLTWMGTNMASPYNMYKVGWNTFSNNARMNDRTDLILGDVVYVSIIFHIPASWLNLLNGYDFYFWWRDNANQTLIYHLRLSSLTRTSRKWCSILHSWKRTETDTELSFYLTSLRQAKSRGVSTTVVGLIFATYSLLVFIFAPICGLLVSSFMFFFPISLLKDRNRPKNW